MTKEELAVQLDKITAPNVDLNEVLSSIRKTYHSELLGTIIFSPNYNPFSPSFYFPDSDKVADCVVDIHRRLHADFYYEGMPDDVVLIEWYNNNDIYCTRHHNFLDADEATIVKELEDGFKQAEMTINTPCVWDNDEELEGFD